MERAPGYTGGSSRILEIRVGIEPTNSCFADSPVNHSGTGSYLMAVVEHYFYDLGDRYHLEFTSSALYSELNNHNPGVKGGNRTRR